MNQIRSDIGIARKLARYYAFDKPFRRGVYRLASAALRVGRPLPKRLLVKTGDGRKLVINPSDAAYRFLYFTGQYEPAISFFVRKAVSAGDVCFDMGANIGWYTTLLMRLAGPAGAVHAFEPMQSTFKLLQKNVALNNSDNNVYIHRTAIGNRSGEVTMSFEDGMPDGHAAVAEDDNADRFSETVPILTLDSYMEERGISNVGFVKADIEGSELVALEGASRLFEQEVPPVFMIEMALETSKRFGYRPQDLILFLDGKRRYLYFAIDERAVRLNRIESFEDESPGANVLCVPAECGSELRESLGIT